jgi:transcriptional regulator with XRE-family HTH domain
MPTIIRRRDTGIHHADASLRRIAYELRIARAASGLSLRALADASGCSRSHLNRIERGRAAGASVQTLCVVFAVLGMRLSVRPYPQGAPLRDAAHARLLTRFRAELPPTITFRTEVPLRNRHVLREFREPLAVRFPLGSRELLRELRAGRLPERSGILLR